VGETPCQQKHQSAHHSLAVVISPITPAPKKNVSMWSINSLTEWLTNRDCSSTSKSLDPSKDHQWCEIVRDSKSNIRNQIYNKCACTPSALTSQKSWIMLTNKCDSSSFGVRQRPPERWCKPLDYHIYSDGETYKRQADFEILEPIKWVRKLFGCLLAVEIWLKVGK
jgi:hypothetical protein